MESKMPEDKKPSPVPWYPQATVKVIEDLSKNDFRKIPAYESYHRYIVEQSDLGRIFRQELVSMIPVLLMDIDPSHSVLDMCASPGSKTVQILEMLHKKTPKPQGFVVANEKDTKRSCLLTH